MPVARLLAFRRAKSLDNGVSVSWFEQTWNKNVLSKNALENRDFARLKKPGFKSTRLPVAFEYFENEHIPAEQIFSCIDNVVKQCGLYGFKLVICCHSGNFNENKHWMESFPDHWSAGRSSSKVIKTSAAICFSELYIKAVRQTLIPLNTPGIVTAIFPFFPASCLLKTCPIV
jgi:endoglucanase